MALEFSPALRNAVLDQIETTLGTSPLLKIWSGSPPATCGTADSGTALVEITLPSDWMAAASAGAKSKSGTWEDLVPTANGTAGHFRVYTSGATCHMQGTVTATGGGGDMTLTSTTIATTQAVTIDTFTLTAGNTDA